MFGFGIKQLIKEQPFRGRIGLFQAHYPALVWITKDWSQFFFIHPSFCRVSEKPNNNMSMALHSQITRISNSVICHTNLKFLNQKNSLDFDQSSIVQLYFWLYKIPIRRGYACLHFIFIVKPFYNHLILNIQYNHLLPSIYMSPVFVK